MQRFPTGLCDPAARAPGALVSFCFFALIVVAFISAIMPASCTSTEEAQSQADVAKVRIDELRAQETSEQAAGHAAKAAAIAKSRVQLEATMAAVRAELEAQKKPDQTEQVATSTAQLVPGGIGAAASGALALVFHLWRSKRLTGLVDELKTALNGSQQTNDELVDSIEDAKVEDPDFAEAFKKAAPLISQGQSYRTRMHVDERQKGPRRRKAKVQPPHVARNLAAVERVYGDTKKDQAGELTPTPAASA